MLAAPARVHDLQVSRRVLYPPTPVESLPDDVGMAGVPGSLFDRVHQYAADVAVDDVGTGAQVIELHAGNELTRRLRCLLVAGHPMLDRFPIVDEEVLA